MISVQSVSLQPRLFQHVPEATLREHMNIWTKTKFIYLEVLSESMPNVKLIISFEHLIQSTKC